jgi:hypothetical protein
VPAEQDIAFSTEYWFASYWVSSTGIISVLPYYHELFRIGVVKIQIIGLAKPTLSRAEYGNAECGKESAFFFRAGKTIWGWSGCGKGGGEKLVVLWKIGEAA